MIDALLDRSGADPDLVENVIWGCVSQVSEQAANIGRQVVLASRLPEHVPGVSVDRQCGSSQQAVHFAA
jgi:acetyl-CoA C-acetyltransferase